MSNFNKYMDRIRADDELKIKTKYNLEIALVKIEYARQKNERGNISMENQNERNSSENHPGSVWRKMMVSAGTLAAAAIVSIAGYVYYMTPVNFVSLDINPGVELSLNAIDRVVAAEATNEDGKAILEGEKIKNQSVEKAIKALVQNAYELGYVDENGSTVIAVMAESKNGEAAERLRKKSSNGVNLAMQAKNAYSAVYATTSDLAFRTQARDIGISPGKYRLVKVLQAMDPEITTEQYKNAKVSEIINKINELAKEENTMTNIDEATRAMIGKAQDAVEETNQNQVKAANRNQEQEQNQSGISQISQNQEQEQNQNGISQTSQNQEQEQNQNGISQTSQNQEQEQNQNRYTSQQVSGSNQGTSTGSSSQSGASASQSGGSSFQGGSGWASQTGGGSGKN